MRKHAKICLYLPHSNSWKNKLDVSARRITLFEYSLSFSGRCECSIYLRQAISNDWY